MRKKILLLSDDLRMTSGIATMSKEIVMGTAHKYDWVQLGAAISHPDYGKILDLNEDIRKISGNDNATLKIYPNNSYGDIYQLRVLLDVEKPDAILHFTDPHYWIWLYDNEHEIRQKVPIMFYHIWDNLPDPDYNKNYYESCDWIGCISKQTYGIVNRVGKIKNKVTQKPLEDWQIKYVPHGINPNTFKPLDNISQEIKDYVLDNKEYDFILFFNNRNLRRKQPSDVIYSYKLFCDMLPKEKSEKCLLLMNTSPVDENGTDLPAVINKLCSEYNVKIINQKIDQLKLNEIYNLVDCTINISNNEGFGLATAESLMSGTPIIVNVTGGLQDQCGFHINGEEFSDKDYIKIGSLHDIRKWQNTEHGEWVIPVWSTASNLNGSPMTPFIFDDRVNNYDVSIAIKKIYDFGKIERKRRGIVGRKWALKNLSSELMCNKMIEGIENTLINFKPRKKYDLYKII